MKEENANKCGKSYSYWSISKSGLASSIKMFNFNMIGGCWEDAKIDKKKHFQ